MNSRAFHPVPTFGRSLLRQIAGWVEQALGEYETTFRWDEPRVSFLAPFPRRGDEAERNERGED